MNSPNTMIHDARSGFQDITALPDFHPSFISWYWLGILVAVFLIAALIFWRLRYRKSRDDSKPTPLSPLENAQTQLNALYARWREHTIEQRALASAVSLVVRSYIDQVWGFPADDRTAKEIAREFEIVLRKHLPALSPEVQQQVIKMLLKFLRTAEVTTFSSCSQPNRDDHRSVDLLLEEARSLLSELNQQIQLETTRARDLAAANRAEAQS